MVASGVSVRRKVVPGWPGCPPLCLPDGCRRLPTRGGFFSPSLDGGLPLLPLFSPTWRSNSAVRSRSAAISAAWRVSCASNSSIRSPRLIHADGRFASYYSLKRESFPVVARDESKQLADRLRWRRFTQRVTHVPRQIIEFFRC